MINQTKIVFLKEIKDAIRDKRAVMAVLSYAFLMPALMGFVAFLMSLDRPEADVKTKLAIANMEAAPGLVAFVEKAGLEVSGAEPPAKDASADDIEIPEGNLALLVIPKDFQEKLNKGTVGELKLYVGLNNREGAERTVEIELALEQYGRFIGINRLHARGVPAVLLTPFVVSKADVSVSNFGLKVVLNGLAVLGVMATIIGGISVALDTLAGERERQSLQTLLAQPVSSRALITGKWSMVSLFSFSTVFLMSLTFIAVYIFFAQDKLPFKLGIDIGGLGLMYLQLLFFSMFVASLLMLVSIQAKSFKEGQTYMSMIMIAPTLIIYVKIFADSRIPDFVRYLPFFADIESLTGLLVDGVVQPVFFVISLGVSLLGTAVCIFFTSRRLASEKLLDEV